MTDYALKDSGKREEFQTGAQRDTRDGKGRFDLISPFMLRRLAVVMERGAIKYDARNWEKGMPFSRFTDSALRHINQFVMGKEDEDHLAQAVFNLMALIHFQETGRQDLDDMPHYERTPGLVAWRCAICGDGYKDTAQPCKSAAGDDICSECSRKYGRTK